MKQTGDFDPIRPWSYFALAARAALHPKKTLGQAPADGSPSGPLAFLAISLTLPSLLGLLLGGLAMPLDIWLRSLLVQFFWCLAMGLGLVAGLWVVGRKNGFSVMACLRVFCYSTGPWVLTFLWALLPRTAMEIMVLLTLIHMLALVYAGLRARFQLLPAFAAACIMIGLVCSMLAISLTGQLELGLAAAS